MDGKYELLQGNKMEMVIPIAVSIVAIIGIVANYKKSTFIPPLKPYICEHTWSEPRAGHQSCEKCNLCVPVPRPECVHDWETTHESNINVGQRVTGYFFVLRCKECGDIKQVKTNINA